jgi:glutathione S-transferase
MVAKSARKQTVGRAATQGLGRAPRAEVVATCSRLVDALAQQMGEQPYFFGDKPTTYDATTYAFAAGVLCPAFDNELRKHAATKKNLVAYEARLKEKYWSATAAV